MRSSFVTLTLSEETSFGAVGELINQHRREVRCISISRLTHDTPIADSISVLNAFKAISFDEMQNLAELNLHSSTTSSPAGIYLIEEITRASGIPLQKFSIQLDFKEELKATDTLLSNLAPSKISTLKQMYLFGAGIDESLLRMTLPKTSQYEPVQFVCRSR
ncbi:hypothetical protein VKT23_015513 [Stygiomarasmius scandens]|uniref:Uncharacterized protein n=1 Tax=Marasmiellus scandens TaxID=2682957 RepID=A0ABR1IZH7_9AGAR